MTSEVPPAYSTLNESSETTVKLNVPVVPEVVIPTTDDDKKPLHEGGFEDRNIRIAFKQKVLCIILFELLAVTFVMVCFVTVFKFRRYFVNYIVCAVIGFLFSVGLLVHCTKARWKKPFIYMFLVFNPVSYGYFISVVAFDVLYGILTAWIHFCIIIFALLVYSVFALHRKMEFTIGNGFCISLFLLIVLYVLSVPFLYLNPFSVLYPAMVVLLLSTYILYDLEAMVSTPYRFVVTPADFVNGALILHIDYLYIFKKWYKSFKSEFVR